MVDIVLVRHASTAWTGVRYCGISDPPLSPSGLAEARAARRGARARPAAGLSGSCRARRAALGRPRRRSPTRPVRPGVEIDPRWREADVGIAEGRTFDELAAIAPDVAAALAGGELAIDWPGGETHASLAARGRDRLARPRRRRTAGRGRHRMRGRSCMRVAVARGRPPPDGRPGPAGHRPPRSAVAEGPLRATVLPSRRDPTPIEPAGSRPSRHRPLLRLRPYHRRRRRQPPASAANPAISTSSAGPSRVRVHLDRSAAPSSPTMSPSPSAVRPDRGRDATRRLSASAERRRRRPARPKRPSRRAPARDDNRSSSRGRSARSTGPSTARSCPARWFVTDRQLQRPGVRAGRDRVSTGRPARRSPCSEGGFCETSDGCVPAGTDAGRPRSATRPGRWSPLMTAATPSSSAVPHAELAGGRRRASTRRPSAISPPGSSGSTRSPGRLGSAQRARPRPAPRSHRPCPDVGAVALHHRGRPEPDDRCAARRDRPDRGDRASRGPAHPVPASRRPSRPDSSRASMSKAMYQASIRRATAPAQPRRPPDPAASASMPGPNWATPLAASIRDSVSSRTWPPNRPASTVAHGRSLGGGDEAGVTDARSSSRTASPTRSRTASCRAC